MAIETYFNDYGTTLNGAIDATQTTIIVNNVAAYPNPFTGKQVHIRIDDEIMLVTAVNTGTNTLTVARAQETTTGLNHANGAQVVHILTAGGLSNIINQAVPTVGVMSSLPGSYSVAGQSYWPTDKPYINMWNGSSFTQYYAPLVTPPPTSSNWLTVNPSQFTGTDTVAGLNITHLTSSNNRGYFRAVPSTPYNIAMSMKMCMASNDNNSWAGAYWLDSQSSPDKFTMLVVRGNSNMIHYNGNSFAGSSGYGSVYDPGDKTLGMTGSGDFHVILSDDGTNRTVYHSCDGINYIVGSGWPRSRSDNAVYNYFGFGGSGTTKFTVTLYNLRIF